MPGASVPGKGDIMKILKEGKKSVEWVGECSKCEAIVLVEDTDLYILPNTPEQKSAAIAYLKTKKYTYQISYANVKESDWYGKHFIEVSFMAGGR